MPTAFIQCLMTLPTVALVWLVVVDGINPPMCVAADPSAPRPNVILIQCDDLGYGDLGCMGHPAIRTPNLDQMAADGVRLTDCYAAAPVCSSSRAGLLTGRSPNRSGIYDWLPENIDIALSTDEPTLPSRLKTVGYQTALIGKWHLNGRFNSDAQPQPSDYGFDHWMATQNNAAPSHERPRNFVRNGTPVGPTDDYSCQLVAKEACRWMQVAQQRDSPFYLHVCFHEPHEPVASPAALVDSYRGIARNDDEAQYFANVTNVDDAVGKILARVADLGLQRRTMILFTSDNGPETLDRYPNARRSYGSAGPLREMKLHVYEGGIRVPGIVRWTGVLPAGEVNATPVSGVDWMPTVCELAGAEIATDKTIDGVSLVPMLQARPLPRNRPLHWMYYRSLSQPKFALREDRWKLLASWANPNGDLLTRDLPGSNINPRAIAAMKSAHLIEFELYDLESDLGEQNNVIDDHPEVAARLKGKAIEIFGELIAEGPSWSQLPSTSEKPASAKPVRTKPTATVGSRE